MRAISMPFFTERALVHGPLDQLAGNLEGNVHLGELDIAGNRSSGCRGRDGASADHSNPSRHRQDDQQKNRNYDFAFHV